MKNFILLTLLFLTGCYKPGGGGSIHTPPENLKANQPILITYKLTVWGSGSKDIEKRYKNVQCHFRVKGGPEFKSIKMVLKNKADQEGMYQCIIPAAYAKSNNIIEYHFDELLDGHYNKRIEKPIKIP
jgi:hypothetical protein